MKIFQSAALFCALVSNANSPTITAPKIASPRPVRAVPVNWTVIVRRPLLASLRIYKKRRTLELPFYSDHIRQWAFSPDGKTLAGVGDGIGLTTPAGKKWLRGYSCVVFLFDVKTGRLKRRLLVFTNNLISGYDRVVWSRDGRFVAALRADSNVTPTPLAVWNARSGQLTAQIREANWNVTAANWTSGGTLLVARANIGVPFAAGEMLLCSSNGAAIRKKISLGHRYVTHIDTRFSGSPRLLVWARVGQNVAEQLPIVQSSICRWEKDSLGAPLVQLPVGDLAFGVAFSQNFAALSSFRQMSQLNASFVTLADLKSKRIVWKRQVTSANISPAMQFSKDGKRIWVGGNYRDAVVMNTRSGAFSGVNAADFPTFSGDEKYFVRPLEQFTGFGNAILRGTKPHLAVAELWEK
jgi:hypothetical protein